jgi:hypothetical protein
MKLKSMQPSILQTKRLVGTAWLRESAVVELRLGRFLTHHGRLHQLRSADG